MNSTLDKRKNIGGWLPAIVMTGAAMVLVACGEKPQTPAPPKLFQQERDALDKAKGVEQTVAKSAEDLKQEAEKQSQ